LTAANTAFSTRFGAPSRLTDLVPDEPAEAELRSLAAVARKSGAASAQLSLANHLVSAEARPAAGDLIFWRFRPVDEAQNLGREAERMIAGAAGERLGAAGIMAVL